MRLTTILYAGLMRIILLVFSGWYYEKYSAGIVPVLWVSPCRQLCARTAATWPWQHSPQPSVQCVTCRMHGVQHSTTLNITCSALQKQSRCPAPKKNYLILLLFSSPAYAGSCSSCGMSWAAMLGLELQTILYLVEGAFTFKIPLRHYA